MKRFFISVSIMFLIFLFVVSWMFYLNNIKNKLLDATKEASEAALNNNIDLAIEKYIKVKDFWDQQESVLIMFVRHEHIDQISISVAKLSSILTKDNLSEFISECSVIEEATEHMWKSELPITINLF